MVRADTRQVERRRRDGDPNWRATVSRWASGSQRASLVPALMMLTETAKVRVVATPQAVTSLPVVRAHSEGAPNVIGTPVLACRTANPRRLGRVLQTPRPQAQHRSCTASGLLGRLGSAVKTSACNPSFEEESEDNKDQRADGGRP